MYSIDPVLGTSVSGSFAPLFAVAGGHKFAVRGKFAETLTSYRVLPARAISAAALLVPTLECVIAASLLIPRIRSAGSLAGAALLAIYAAAMGLNLLRGRRDLECGCLGPRGGGVISPALIRRDSLMAIALAAIGLLRWSDRSLGWLDAGTVVAAVCALALLHTAAMGLLELETRRQPRER